MEDDTIESSEEIPPSFFFNEVFMWGRGSVGQLGTGDKKKMKRPTKLKELSHLGIIRFSTGGNHSAGTTGNGSLYVWGCGDSGCLGRGDHTTLALPRKVLLPNSLKVSLVACGDQHTCFLSFENDIYSVGSNVYGQLGHGHLNSCSVPKKIDLLDDVRVKKIFCGKNQTACIDSNGHLYTWGESRAGQLGHGFFFPQNSPKIVDAIKNIEFQEISFGSSHAIALSRDCEVYIWGKTSYDIGSDIQPKRLASLLGTKVVQVQSGEYHLAVLTYNGRILTWGCGLHGQLGLGDKEDKNTPWVVKAFGVSRVTRISCGGFTTMALMDTGQLFSWGDNQKFSCGHSPDKRDSCYPVEVIIPPEYTIVQIVSGGLSAGVLVGLKEGYSDDSRTKIPRFRDLGLGENKTLRVMIGTWNINAQSDLDMSPWISSDGTADIIVIGFQELIELSSHIVAQDEAISQIAKTNLVRDNICKYWARKLETTINCGTTDYSLLRDIRLAGVYLAVFVKSSLRSRIFQIRASITKVGVLGKLGNKGGVAIRFSVFDSSNSLCFVNSHLAAGKSHVDKRNTDYINIISSLSFQLEKQKYSVLDHKQIFWLGDLNYRIDLERDEILKKVEDQDFATLLTYDQLTIEKAHGRVFEGFTEPPIYFSPTYKYDPGTNNFDSSEKNRCPSWCDRILYRGEDIKTHLYRSHGECLSSDHKPVSAWYSITVKETDITKKLEHLKHASAQFKAEEIGFSSDRSISPTTTQKAPQVLSQNYRKRPHELSLIPDSPYNATYTPKQPSPTTNWRKVKPFSKDTLNKLHAVGTDILDSEQRKDYAGKLNDGISFIQKKGSKIKGAPKLWNK